MQAVLQRSLGKASKWTKQQQQQQRLSLSRLQNASQWSRRSSHLLVISASEKIAGVQPAGAMMTGFRWKEVPSRPPHDRPTTTLTQQFSTAVKSTESVVPFQLADIGEGIAEVELMKWFVNVGDTVSQFDPVCEVQSDKATVEITSRFDGVIESLEGNIGDMIKVGTPLLHVRVQGDYASSSSAPVEEEKTETESSSSSSVMPPLPPNTVSAEQPAKEAPQGPMNGSIMNGYLGASRSNEKNPFDSPKARSINGHLLSKAKVLATPAVRKLAMDHSIDLSHVEGTGPDGRILKADLLKLVQPKHNEVNGHNTQPERCSQESMTESDVIPIRGYNRLMVKTMTESLQIPHMGYGDEVDMSQLLALKETTKGSPNTPKVSVLAFCIKALSMAITEYPIVNSSIDVNEMNLTVHRNHNVAIAMDTPRGLVVPVLRDCQDKSILDIASELDRLKETAREGRIQESDLKGATITMSNIGPIGGTYMAPVITSPQVVVGAIGRIQRLPRFVGDSNEVQETHIMNMAWAGDHRALDGATLARFVERWKLLLEKPSEMVVLLK